MSLLGDLSKLFGDAFEKLGLSRAFGEVVVSQRPDLGQFQCNGALGAAREAERPPRQIAEEVIAALAAGEVLVSVDVAGAGFINMVLRDDYLATRIEALAADARMGVPAVEEPLHVLIDFGGPNVAKGMHVGHLRSSIIGDSLQRLFRFAGHRVTSDIHLGDWGTPMGMLIEELRRRRPELPYFDPASSGPHPTEPPVTLDDLEEMYPEAAARAATDPVEAEKARLATLELQRGRAGYRALWQQFVDASVASLRADFDALGVKFDLWYGESTVHDRIGSVIERMRASGRTDDSDGALVVPVQQPGDDKEIPPLLLLKSDGAYLYATTDLATIDQRVRDLGADLILYVVDARQALHFEQLFRAAHLTGVAPDTVRFEHLGFGTVNGPDGKPYKTREGRVPKLKDLIDMVIDAARQRLQEADIAQDYPPEEQDDIARKVGLAALKFGDLSNHRTSNYVFDLDRFTSFDGKTGPYLQYSAVRMKSILRKAAELELAPGPVTTPNLNAERSLMLQLTLFPEAVARAVEFRTPNHVAEFCYDLAATFTRFYDACHILSEEDPRRQASWLRLVETTLAQSEIALGLLGIEVPERM